ncbi:MAG: amino acid ABC transporter permease [Hyphomicrobiales bacterium]
MTDVSSKAAKQGAFVRGELLPMAPPPHFSVGVFGWMRRHLFSSPLNVLLTLLGAYVIWIVFKGLIEWGFVDAVWRGADRNACLTSVAGHPVGACWAFVHAKLGQFTYGLYPASEIWRVNLCYVIGFVGLVGLMVPSIPFKAANLVFMFCLYPLLALILLSGGHFFAMSPGAWVKLGLSMVLLLAVLLFWAERTKSVALGSIVRLWGLFAVALAILLSVLQTDWGLMPVRTDLWGGLTVTLVIAATGIVLSLPVGIVLALGRRSRMPIVRTLSVLFIEFWRGVPLITVLFMASVMLPLFLPEGVDFDKLLRCLVCIALFWGAYMAEVVRGGLQALNRGQYEGGHALGFGYWQLMRLIILPQALKVVIPGITNTIVALFKDTSLVTIVGLFDLLGIIQASFSDPKWITPASWATAYGFAAMIYWLFCFAMSRYSVFMERRLNVHNK